MALCYLYLGFRSQACSLLRRRTRHRSTVAVGMSGGVDSSVAALLLQQQGHDVVGVHMSNWDGSEDGLGHDCGEREREDAERVCRQLRIGFHEVSFQREYWHEVFTPFLKAYQDGGTPNPDLSCNRHIKFGHFAEHARQLGADRVATGHYARLRADGGGRVQLLAALDEGKDQSYFLAAVRQACGRWAPCSLRTAAYRRVLPRTAAYCSLRATHCSPTYVTSPLTT